MGVLWKGWRDNIVLKAISLLTSIAIWAYVGFTERAPVITRDFDATVVETGTAPDDYVVRLKQETVRVTVRGPKDDLDKLTPDSVKALVDLRAAQPNSQRVPITRFRGPAGGAHLDFDSARLYVGADVVPKVRRRMTVTASYSNEPPAGRVYACRVDPSTAEVIGARESVDRVSRLVVYVGSQGGNTRGDASVKALDPGGVLVRDVQIDPPTIHAELDLVEAPTSRTLVVSPAIKGRPSPPYVVTEAIVDPIQVTVSGPSEALASLTHLATAEIPIDGIKSDVLRDVALQLPPTVVVKDGRSTVRVIVRVAEAGKPPTAQP